MKYDFKNRIFILDGAMGTMLQRAGMQPGEDQNSYLLSHTDVVEEIHRKYARAGSDILYAPTFSLNRQWILQTGKEGAEAAVAALIQPAKKIREEMAAEGRSILVAMDMGPLGEMLEPMGSLSFEDAYDAYRTLVLAGAKAGADLVVIETMTDIYEVRAAVLAAKENCGLPVFVSMTFEENGRTFTGTGIEAMAVQLEGLGVDAMGINCSLGPVQILPMIRRMKECTSLPVFAKPNAGLPDPATGEYDITAAQFADSIGEFFRSGVSMAGGCCGTTPEYIAGIAEQAKWFGRETGGFSEKEIGSSARAASVSSHAAPVSGWPGVRVFSPLGGGAAAAAERRRLKLSSRSRVVAVDHVTVIGERLNPTGKKKMKQALLDHDMDYLLDQALEQIEAGAEILDVNVGVPGLDEAKLLPEVIRELQSVTDLPLQIDSSDPEAIEAALRVYNGKPIINSVSGEDQVLARILPIVKKYGAAVIGLTLDESGIPPTAEERFAIAEKILNRAMEYGIPRENLIIDCLTLTASAQQKEVNETLRAVRMVKERLGLRTALGVSNVSFGLPVRPLINRTFLALAMENGLDLPILNPNDEDMMGTVFAFNVLKNRDENAADYIGRYTDERFLAGLGKKPAQKAAGGAAGTAADGAKTGSPANVKADPSGQAKAGGISDTKAPDLFRAIENGMKREAAEAVRAILLEEDGMTVVSSYLIPALEEVGKKFEKGTLFLPQMLQAAGAAQECFEVVKGSLSGSVENTISLGDVVLATVEGDIHDIGKNIVRVIMENYGFHMIDLGRDVPKEKIVETVLKHDIRLVGLSALMTTTLKSMEETIAAIREASPQCRVMVGGAVLTEEYAKAIGADYYCRDAMKSVEAAREVFGTEK